MVGLSPLRGYFPRFARFGLEFSGRVCARPFFFLPFRSPWQVSVLSFELAHPPRLALSGAGGSLFRVPIGVVAFGPIRSGRWSLVGSVPGLWLRFLLPRLPALLVPGPRFLIRPRLPPRVFGSRFWGLSSKRGQAQTSGAPDFRSHRFLISS